MLSVTNKPYMLNVVMLNMVMLSVVMLNVMDTCEYHQRSQIVILRSFINEK
jgi:hypothetical protein